MRIGHYAPTLWAPGGIAAYVRRLGEGQSARGHAVTYLSTGRVADEPHETRTVKSAAELRELARELPLDVLHLHKEVPWDASGDEGGPVVVRTMHGNQASCPTGSRFLEARGRPCDRVAGLLPCTWGHVVDRCGSVRPSAVAGHVRRFRLEREVLPGMLTHTVSEFIRARMIEAGFDASMLVPIPSPAPVQTERPGPPPVGQPPRFVYVGRIVPAKGARWLLEAMSLSEERYDVDVVGDGYELDSLKRYAQESGLADRVMFHGWLAPDGVKQVIGGSRAVVFPSVWHEPAGLVTLEAAAAGRAVVASRVGGIPEYALPEFALLAEPNDAYGLARHLDTLARDHAKAASMGLHGWELSQSRFSMDGFLDKIDGLYEMAL